MVVLGANFTFVLIPASECLDADTSSGIDRSLRLRHALLLQRPGRIGVEVDLVKTQGWVDVHHVITEVHFRVSLQLLSRRTGSGVELMDVTAFEEVTEGVLRCD